MDKEQLNNRIKNEIESILIETELPFSRMVKVRLGIGQTGTFVSCLSRAITKIESSSTGSELEQSFIGHDGMFNFLLDKLLRNSLQEVDISSQDIETLHLALCMGSNTLDILSGRIPMGNDQIQFLQFIDKVRMAGGEIPGEVQEFWEDVQNEK